MTFSTIVVVVEEEEEYLYGATKTEVTMWISHSLEVYF